MVKKILLGILAVLALIFAGAQFIRPDFSNPAVVAGMEIEKNVAFTPEVRTIIKKSCADCHSNETKYPWYSKVTPINFWLKSHIDDGRAHLNFSTDPAGEEWDEICKEVTRARMPLPSYTWGHPESVLSDSDKKTLCDWAGTLTAVERGKGVESKERGERNERERKR